MSKGIVRRPVFVALVVAFTVAAAGVALANEYEPVRPPTGQPGALGPIVIVCRATDTMTARAGKPGQCTSGIDNLMNGETVQVAVAIFGVNNPAVNLRECTLDLTLCDVEGATITTGRTGVSYAIGQPTSPSQPVIDPTPFTVKTSFRTPGGQTVNCLLTPCVIYASSSSFEVVTACHGLTFAGGPASVCTQLFSPTTTVPPTTSTSTSSTSTTSTSTTSTSTSSTSTSSTSTSSTSTSSTSTSSTSTSSTSTSSTSTSVPASTSTSTSVPASTSTSVMMATTSTAPGTTDRCNALLTARKAFNSQIDQLKAAVEPSLSDQLEAVRAQANAQLDAALTGCARPI